MMNICGIDVSKDTLEIVIRKNNRSQKSKTFDNSPEGHIKLIQFLTSKKVEYVCLEATGSYHLDIAILISVTDSLKIMVINPKVASDFAKIISKGTKTDAIDAEILAQYANRMDFIEWQAPDNHILSLRTCGRWLDASSKELIRLKNQLHAFEVTETTPDFIIESVKKRIKELGLEITDLEKQAIVIIKNNDELNEKYEQVISIKGIADKTAIKLLGEVLVLSPDMTAKQWVAHAGLFPRTAQSGSSINKKSGIGKAGNRYIKGALYMSALVAAYHDPHISGFYQHLVNDNGLKKIQALCAVMRKLLLSIHAMFRTKKAFNGKYFYTIKEA